MKVSTDACILGAYADAAHAVRILDIGAGTGLLSLMIAQRSTAQIEAVEIDQNACLQAEMNFKNSPWADRLTLIHKSIQNFTATVSGTYDLIVSNPPFFVNSYKSPEAARSLARHTDTLGFDVLAQCVHGLLAEKGSFVVLLPSVETRLFEHEMQRCHLHVAHRLLIRDTQERTPHRVISVYRREAGEVSAEELIIKNGDGSYTDAFIELLKPYYLYL